jgi:protein CpxP
MKRVLALSLVFTLALAWALAAPQGRGHGFMAAAEPGGGLGPGGGYGFLLRHLDLTDQQKTDIKKILDTERSVMQPVMTQLRDNREALQKATENGQFDESTVTSLADKQGTLMAQVIVSRERVKSQIWQVLTPEQRDKAQQFHEQRAERGAWRMGRRGPGAKQ